MGWEQFAVELTKVVLGWPVAAVVIAAGFAVLGRAAVASCANATARVVPRATLPAVPEAPRRGEERAYQETVRMKLHCGTPLPRTFNSTDAADPTWYTSRPRLTVPLAQGSV